MRPVNQSAFEIMLDLEKPARTVAHAPALHRILELKDIQVPTLASDENNENATEGVSVTQSYSIDYTDKNDANDSVAQANLIPVPPPATATPIRASDEAIAPFLELAKTVTTVFTKEAARKEVQSQREEAKRIQDEEEKRRSEFERKKRVEEREKLKMRKGKNIVKLPRAAKIQKPKPEAKIPVEDTKFEEALNDELADPNVPPPVPSWLRAMYNPDASGLSEGEKAKNDALLKKAHRAGDHYSWVEGVLLPGEYVRYHRDICALKDVKLEGCDPKYTKFSEANFTELASGEDDSASGAGNTIIKTKKVSREVKALQVLNEKKKLAKLPFNPGPLYRDGGVPIYCVTSPFVFGKTD